MKRWIQISKRVVALSMVAALTTATLCTAAPSALEAFGGVTTSVASACTVYTSVVAFSGSKWWVIGNEEQGIHPKQNSLTLLAMENDFGERICFRDGAAQPEEGYSEYESKYYANNPGENPGWTKPHEYRGSTQQLKMEELADREISLKEQQQILPRTLTKEDEIAGGEVQDQKVWPLSGAEWMEIRNTQDKDPDVLRYSGEWWLRTHDIAYGSGRVAYSANSMGDFMDAFYIDNYANLRPACNFELSSVFLTSLAEAASGKNAVAVGDGFTNAVFPTRLDQQHPVKFTLREDGATLTVNRTPTERAQTLQFGYSGAATGPRQYLSSVLTDETATVQYYAKLKDCTSAGAAEGVAELSFANLPDGDYTLQLFSEQLNGDFDTDFCGQPYVCSVSVQNGEGKIKRVDLPTHLQWDDSAPGTAKWSPVENAVGYNLQLLQDGTAVGQSIRTAQSQQDCMESIRAAGEGEYTFQVQAIGDGVHTLDSEWVLSPTAFSYRVSQQGKEDSNSSSPATGEDQSIALWIVLCSLGMCGGVWIVIRGRCRR